MKRREFLATVVALAATHTTVLGELNNFLPSIPPDVTLAAFNRTLEWLANNGWLRMLADVAGVPEIAAIRAPGDGPVLTQGFTPSQLSLIKSKAGFSDFGGNALLVPGKPAMSLLYFALANPRVLLPDEGRPDHAKYPGLGQIESVENYIYALAPAIALDLKRHVLAVFAYEFRLKEKTPHNAHADMVYARTGISRVGSDPAVWNPVERRYTNAVANAGTKQQSAVVPARYGLFLAEAVTHEQNAAEFGRIGCPPKEYEAVFLLPVRKIIDGDALLGGASLSFAETHRDEKLARLFDALHRRDRNMRMPAPFELTRAPFYRQNASTTRGDSRLKQHNLAENEDLVNLARAGSSVLLIPRPGPLVRPAVQNFASGPERARFVVPPGTAGDYGNRFYSTLYLADKPRKEEIDEILSASALKHNGLHLTPHRAPKNGPEFVNIRHQYSANDKITHLGPGVPGWETTIAKGGYEAALFLDGLCDGCVQAELLHVQPSIDVHSWKVLSEHILPAFSIVSAPDFFSQVDPIDLDVAELDLGYVEGGTEVVSGARVRANPFHKLPGGSDDAFPFTSLRGDEPSETEHIEFDSSLTITAVISASAAGAEQHDFCMNDPRDPHQAPSTNTLPDASSNVFAPGWDITYSTVSEPAGTLPHRDKKQTFYYASFGLGSPFPEDMKLCAAANGMWASLSPDAARTFYGRLEPIRLTRHKKDKGRNSTVLPLLDTEIGQHAASPAPHETRGWDGEQGPFLAVSNCTPHRLQVNYTDISRSDYVVNACNAKMNMQSLQTLSVGESRQRMYSMVQSLRSLPEPYQPRRSKLWLISVEVVEDWSRGAEGIGIPIDLAGTHNREWATICKETAGTGRGYLYIFGKLASQSQKNADTGDPVRVVDDLDRVYVCQAVRAGDLRDPKPQDANAWIIHWTMMEVPGTLPQLWTRSGPA